LFKNERHGVEMRRDVAAFAGATPVL